MGKGAPDATLHNAARLADPTRPYGVLVVEATRLTEEFRNTCDILRTTADAVGSG
ncbi:hypothetical protein [Streptomyces sp. NPDC005336]|uniref:hypothetical protein n=1 Tax=unclassified Streptomyces TaxID=2593676 RepID=UPI0033AEB2D3